MASIFSLILFLSLSGSATAESPAEVSMPKFLQESCKKTSDVKTCVEHLSLLPESQTVNNTEDLLNLSFMVLAAWVFKTYEQEDAQWNTVDSKDEDCVGDYYEIAEGSYLEMENLQKTVNAGDLKKAKALKLKYWMKQIPIVDKKCKLQLQDSDYPAVQRHLINLIHMLNRLYSVIMSFVAQFEAQRQ